MPRFYERLLGDDQHLRFVSCFEHFRAEAARRLPDRPVAKGGKTFFAIKELRF
jgi:hypothetical protein